MRQKKQIHYLDSGVITGFLNAEAEPQNFAECEPVIKAAEQEIIVVFTSAFTMGEVVYIKPTPGEEPLPDSEQEEIISLFFSQTWLQKVDFEPDMAEINRYLLREYGRGGRKGLKPYDSVHLATAIRMKVDFFDTLDDELINKLPKSVSYPPRYPKPVTIQRPQVEGFQMSLL